MPQSKSRTSIQKASLSRRHMLAAGATALSLGVVACRTSGPGHSSAASSSSGGTGTPRTGGKNQRPHGQRPVRLGHELRGQVDSE